MEMHLNQISIRTEQPRGICRSQLTVEGDVTIPGSLRETTHVLHAGAMAVIESAEAMQDRISASGRVIFRVLYTQGESAHVHSIEASADFTHMCELAGAAPKADVYARAQVEHVDASVQNGRMSMRAILRLYARATESLEMDVLTGVDTPGAERKTEEITLRRTTAQGTEDVLIREEFTLPAELAVHDTLGAWATAEFFDTAGGQGRVGISGEVTLEAMHASDLPGKPIVLTRHTIPVSQSVEISGEIDDLVDGRLIVKDVAVASQDLGDGERKLRAEVLLGLSAWSEKEERVEVLTDAYTTQGDALRLNGASVTMRTGANRMYAAESGKGSLMLPEGAKPIRTMLAAFALPVMTSFLQQGNRLITEGIMETTLMYMSGDSDVPVSVQLEAPFRVSFAANAAPEDFVVLTAGNVEAVPITSDRAELRYILHAEIDGVKTEDYTLIVEAMTVPSEKTTQDIILYFTQPGENAWDIAKRYRISEQELKLLNPDLTGTPKTGQGVIVWRRSAI